MGNTKKIGATIALNGEKQFKQAVIQCNTALKEMKSEMKLVSAQTEGEANSLAALQKKHDTLQKTLDATKQKEDAVRDALQHAQDNYCKAGDTLNSYKSQLAAAQEKLDGMKESGTASNKELEAQQEVVDSLSGKVEQSEKSYQSAEKKVSTWKTSLNNAETATVQVSKALEENDKYLAEAESSTTKTATSIDEFGRKTKAANGCVKEIGQSLLTLEAKKSLSDILSDLSDKMGELGTKAYDAALELDEGYDTITTKTGATGESLKSLQGVADKIFRIGTIKNVKLCMKYDKFIEIVALISCCIQRRYCRILSIFRIQISFVIAIPISFDAPVQKLWNFCRGAFDDWTAFV